MNQMFPLILRYFTFVGYDPKSILKIKVFLTNNLFGDDHNIISYVKWSDYCV